METTIREIVNLRADSMKRGQSFYAQIRSLVESTLAAGASPEQIAEAAGVRPATVLNWTSEQFRTSWKHRQRVTGLDFEPLSDEEEEVAKSARRAYKGDPLLHAVTCPQCKAAPGAGCVTTKGKESPYPHTVRVKASGSSDRLLTVVNRISAFVQQQLDRDHPVQSTPTYELDNGLAIAVRNYQLVLLFKLACGHTFWRLLPDSEYDLELVMRDRYRTCRDCFYAETNLLAAATAAVEGWPDLVGTPKQVSWAGTIRTKILSNISTWMAEMDFSEAWSQRFMDRMLTVVDAHWWIEARDVGPWLLIRSLLVLEDFR